MFTVLIILTVLVAILLIGVVLIQKSKGGGLSSSFGSANQIMGVRNTTNFVEKAPGLSPAPSPFSLSSAAI